MRAWQPWPGLGNYRVVVRVSFRRDGSILGVKRTFAQFHRADDREPVYRAILEAFARCAALPFTRPIGEAIAGRQYTFTFRPRAQKT